MNHRNSQKAAVRKCFSKQLVLQITISTGDICVGVSFRKVAGLKACNFTKKRPKHGSFPLNIAKFLRTAFFIEHLRWLLLTVLPHYSKVTWGVCSLISCLHVLSVLSRMYTKRCTNNYLLSRNKTISSLLILIDHVLPISDYVLEKR